MKLTVNEDGSLLSRAGRALGWSLASTAIGRLGTLAIGIVIARLLGPAEFGSFAVAMVALLAILSFNELGVSLAIVRWPGDPEEIAPTVATLAAGSSVLIYLGCFLGAPAFATAMGDPGSASVIRVLAICVIINGLVATPVAMLQRRFRQDRKMLVDQVSTWSGAFVSIGCAIAGMGAMSLAIGQLVGALAGAVLFIAFAPTGMRFGFDAAKARALLRFGLPLAGSSIIVFAVTNVDKLVVGAVLGPTALGFYVLAVNLANWPVNVFSLALRSVAPAALARLQHDRDAMRTAFTTTIGLLAAVTLPICVLLAAAADPLIRFVYGPVWSTAATVLPWLGLLAAVRILFEMIYDYFVVLANSRVVFTVQVIWLVALIPALYAGAKLAGPWGAGAAQLAVGLVIVLPCYLVELQRTGLRARRLAAAVGVPVAGALVVTAVVLFADQVVPWDLGVLALAGAVALGMIALLLYRMRGTIRTLRAAAATPPVDQGVVNAI